MPVDAERPFFNCLLVVHTRCLHLIPLHQFDGVYHYISRPTDMLSHVSALNWPIG